MRTSKTEKLAEKLAATRAEYKKAKHEEAEAARKEARREFTKAARRAGLLALVAGGSLSTADLEAEFRAVVERLKKAPTAAAAAPAQEPELPEAEQPGDHRSEGERKSFWAR